MLKHNTILHDRYRILNCIGSGGTSNVYLAEDRHIGTQWAVKEISGMDPYISESAATEIEMLKTISSPMFPRIVDAFKERNAFYIVSDYIKGITMEELIEQEPLGTETAVSMMKNVARALMILHENDPPILYLDMKPSNIMIKADGSIRLIDFGIATSGKSRHRYGTIGYAPPEQLDESAASNQDYESGPAVQSDIFAFGMTYLVARTGFRPDANINSTLQYIKNEKRLSSKEKSFLYHCINEQKQKRFASMRDVLENLNHIDKTHMSFGRKITIPILILSLVSIGCYFGKNKYVSYVNYNTSCQMLSDASIYLKNGEYTADGIKVISEYVDSGNLDNSTRSKYAYIVAKANFEIFHDYDTAEKYYRMVDVMQYPEVDYCMVLCQLQKSFVKPKEKEVLECLREYYSAVLKYPENARKYENLLTIASCYEWYTEDINKGRRLAAGVLNRGLNDLENDRNEITFEAEELEKYRTKYKKRINDIKERISISDTRR